MQHSTKRSLHLAWAVGLVCAYCAGFLTARPAQAQATISADAGLDRYYKPESWVPLRVQLTNAGVPVKVDVRARFLAGTEGVDEYSLPTQELQSGANKIHTLYLKAPASFSTQPLQVELLRDGRLLNRVRPNTVQVTDGDWLAVGIGASDSTLKLMTTVSLGPQQLAPGTRAWMGRGQPARVNVAILDPQKIPDRWQGLDAADMVVLGEVSERDFTPEQLAALRDYVHTGGLLILTGGVNWSRLTTPFFADLLPVRVTGGRTAGSAAGLGGLIGRPGPEGQHAVCAATLKPGALVKARHEGVPLVVAGNRGSGRVVYLAFDPSLAPFRNWDAVGDLWKSILLMQAPASVLSTVASAENPEYYMYGGGSNVRLADAPFAISQLDIPAFYIVALFLLAYIIVLVPVNYYLLKAKDKKEYAWLTTPAIVAVFSLGAYMIGYGFKGGRTLMVNVGVIETHAGNDAAPTLTYAGLFSPRKTGYDIQLAAAGASGDAASTLLSEPPTTQYTPGMRVVEGDAHRIDDFAVDMWAMRVLQAQGVTRLGKGITATWRESGGQLTGTIRNGSPVALEDCRIVVGSQAAPVPALPPGAQAEFTVPRSSTSTGTVLPTTLLGEIQGTDEPSRMRRAVLRALCVPAGNAGAGMGWRTPAYPLLIGWVKDPAVRFRVNGRPPREQAATLMVVHLDR